MTILIMPMMTTKAEVSKILTTEQYDDDNSEKSRQWQISWWWRWRWQLNHDENDNNDDDEDDVDLIILSKMFDFIPFLRGLSRDRIILKSGLEKCIIRNISNIDQNINQLSL